MAGPSRDYDRVELVWPGKRTEVERVRLPFQTIERVNDVRRARGGQSPMLTGATDLPDWWPDGWRNKLIWGDNKYVLASLLDEFAGKVDLIYIDPPFATGADFIYRARVGDQEFDKLPTAVEELAYRDTWADGFGSYCQMMQERLALAHELLSETGSIYLHCDDTAVHYLRMIMDHTFGAVHYQNELVWRRATSHNDPSRFGRIVDHILFYAKGEHPFWAGSEIAMPKTDEQLRHAYPAQDKRGRYRSADLTGPSHGGEFGSPSTRPWHSYDVYGKGRVWSVPKTGSYAEYIERVFIPGYRRIEGIHERLNALDAAGLIHHPDRGVWPGLKRYAGADQGNPPQDLILDPQGFTNYNKSRGEYAGYPTQKPEALIERFVKASTRPGDLVLDFFAGSGTAAVVAEKLGRRWIGADLGRFAIQTTRKRLLDIPGCRPFEVLNLGRYERRYWQGIEAGDAIHDYYRFILQLFGAQPITGFAHMHGERGGRMVHVGATDAPVTRDELERTLEECAANGIAEVDVLGWEWEMGLNPAGKDELAAKHQVNVRLFNIPREVMDKRAVEAGDVHFFELSVVEAGAHLDGTSVEVQLTGFLPAVDDYMLQKVDGKVTKWSDWIDYWSVDFDFDGETFINQWQAYRTRKDPKLALRSDPHQYPGPGDRRVVVKVIDIFGNDTTRELTVTIGT